jgi:dephospho-CoA kinase
MNTPKIGVGLTGGIGSGKSEAAAIFASLGARVLSADRMAAGLIDTRKDIRDRIRRAFGEGVILPGGGLDRKAMAKLAFSDDRAVERLNAIVHPRVLEAMERELARFKSSGREPVMIIEAALLYEAGAEGMFDYTVVVDAPEEERIARIMKRDHASRSDALSRIRAQMPSRRKAGKADITIRNEGSIGLLKKHCTFVYTILLGLAAASHEGPA